MGRTQDLFSYGERLPVKLFAFRKPVLATADFGKILQAGGYAHVGTSAQEPLGDFQRSFEMPLGFGKLLFLESPASELHLALPAHSVALRRCEQGAGNTSQYEWDSKGSHSVYFYAYNIK